MLRIRCARMKAYQPVRRLSTGMPREPGAGAAGGRPAEQHGIDDRDGEQHRASQQQPALEARLRAERGDQRTAEGRREQADEAPVSVDEVADVRPDRAAVSRVQGVFGQAVRTAGRRGR